MSALPVIEDEQHPLEPPPSRVCDDCGTVLVGRFCHECGEDNAPPRRELKDLTRDALDNLFSFTEHVIPTLRDLAIDPGRILRGLRDGDTKRYLSPFKLYLSATVLFFLFLSLTGVGILQFEVKRTSGPVAITQDAEGLLEQQGFFIQPRTLVRQHQLREDTPVVKVIEDAAKAETDTDNRAILASWLVQVKEPAVINADMAEWIPRGLWLMMPIYALMIWPLYAKGTLVADHFIFSLWAHTSMFLLTILGGLWNFTGITLGFGFALLAYQVYLTIGLKTYYGRSWLGAILKGGLLTSVYLVMWGGFGFAFLIYQAVKFLPPGYLFSE